MESASAKNFTGFSIGKQDTTKTETGTTSADGRFKWWQMQCNPQ
jgi:hypothetical protein